MAKRNAMVVDVSPEVVESNGHAVGLKPGGAKVLEVAPYRPSLFRCDLVGTAPLVIHAFSAKQRKAMRDKQEAGDAAKSKKARDPKDFEAEYRGALHIGRDKAGKEFYGIPANGIRAAMISACRVAGVVMTRAKLAVFVVADGFDVNDSTPLVKITSGEPFPHECSVRLETGVADVRVRPMWHPGWTARLNVQYDESAISAASVANLLIRAGAQVGICEGRPDSRKSVGMGWGTFDVKSV